MQLDDDEAPEIRLFTVHISTHVVNFYLRSLWAHLKKTWP